MILQTMFLRGECGGAPIDNTTEEEVAAWLALADEIRPRQVMVYSLDRDTPLPNARKGSPRGPAGHRLPRRSPRHSLLGRMIRSVTMEAPAGRAFVPEPFRSSEIPLPCRF